VTQLQKQVIDLEQKLQAESTALQARVQELSLLSQDAVAGETSLAAQLAQLREHNGRLTVQLQQAKEESVEAQGLLRKANEDAVRLSTEAESFRQKTTKEFAQATSERSATQAALEGAESAKREFQLAKETQDSHSKKATKADKKIRKNLIEENAELRSQLDRLTRRSTKKLDETKKALLARCSDLEQQQWEITELKAASVAQATRTSDLQLKCKERKTELKRVKSELKERQFADQVLQEKFKGSELRLKKVEESASKHKKRVQELHERFGLSEGFQQQDTGGYAKFASPHFASPQFASPPIQRGSRGFAGSPVHMASLNAEDNTRSPCELKKVL
jgi:chromosome segregation ATPase